MAGVTCDRENCETVARDTENLAGIPGEMDR